MTRWMAAALLAAGLAGCGSGGGDDSAARNAGDAAAPAASGWDAMQPCAMLDVSKLSALTGGSFETAALKPMSPMTDSTAATAMCQYAGAGGEMAMLLTREAPYDDATPEALEKARTANGMMEPAEAVPGLGKAAFWRTALIGKTLQVFYDERRSVVVTLVGKEATLEQASAVARAVAP